MDPSVLIKANRKRASMNPSVLIRARHGSFSSDKIQLKSAVGKVYSTYRKTYTMLWSLALQAWFLEGQLFGDYTLWKGFGSIVMDAYLNFLVFSSNFSVQRCAWRNFAKQSRAIRAWRISARIIIHDSLTQIYFWLKLSTFTKWQLFSLLTPLQIINFLLHSLWNFYKNLGQPKFRSLFKASSKLYYCCK